MSDHAAGDASAPSTFNILFVCTGNTCRSPLAEGIARAELQRRGWSNVVVGSAGLAARTGEPASRQAVVVAERHGADLGEHRSRPLTPELAAWADLILAMSPSHLDGIDALGGAEKATTLGDFVAGGDGYGFPVADPYGGSEAVYEATFRELEALVEGMLDRLAPILAP